MKTSNVLRIGILSIFAMAFNACQKTVLTNPGLTSEAQVIKTSNAPDQPTLGLSFDKSPLVVGQPFTVTFSSDIQLGCGEARIQMNMAEGGTKENPTPTYDGSSSNWITVSSADLSNSSYPTYTFTPTQTGQLSFRAQYVPKTGCGLKESQYSVFPTIIQECITGLTTGFTHSSAGGLDPKGNPYYNITVTYHVENCVNNYIGKLQGGLVNDAVVTNISDHGYIKLNNGSPSTGAPVIVWDNVGTGNYSVTYTVARPAGVSVPITGQWSYSADGLAEPYYAAPLNFDFQ
jgi:hypothetical protein